MMATLYLEGKENNAYSFDLFVFCHITGCRIALMHVYVK